MSTPLKTQAEIIMETGKVAVSTTVYCGPGYPECPKAKAQWEKPELMYLTAHGMMDVAEAAAYFASIADKALAIPEKHLNPEPKYMNAHGVMVTAEYFENLPPVNPAYKDAPIKVQSFDGPPPIEVIPKGHCVFHDPSEEIAFSE